MITPCPKLHKGLRDWFCLIYTDAVVYDPICAEPFGVKCPYSCCQITPIEACARPNFCCTFATGETNAALTLKKNTHITHRFRGKWESQRGNGVTLSFSLRRDSVLNVSISTKSFGRRNYYLHITLHKYLHRYKAKYKELYLCRFIWK